jgi:hypothetical protein
MVPSESPQPGGLQESSRRSERRGDLRLPCKRIHAPRRGARRLWANLRLWHAFQDVEFLFRESGIPGPMVSLRLTPGATNVSKL